MGIQGAYFGVSHISGLRVSDFGAKQRPLSADFAQVFKQGAEGACENLQQN